MLKLPRLLRLGRLTRKLSVIAAARFFRIVMLLVMFVLLGHLLACAFYSVGSFIHFVRSAANFCSVLL